jgi:hypothetical protein
MAGVCRAHVQLGACQLFHAQRRGLRALFNLQPLVLDGQAARSASARSSW